jgi:hypothetical protein
VGICKYDRRLEEEKASLRSKLSKEGSIKSVQSHQSHQSRRTEDDKISQKSHLSRTVSDEGILAKMVALCSMSSESFNSDVISSERLQRHLQETSVRLVSDPDEFGMPDFFKKTEDPFDESDFFNENKYYETAELRRHRSARSDRSVWEPANEAASAGSAHTSDTEEGSTSTNQHPPAI